MEAECTPKHQKQYLHPYVAKIQEQNQYLQEVFETFFDVMNAQQNASRKTYYFSLLYINSSAVMHLGL
jgi:hypothetical protein